MSAISRDLINQFLSWRQKRGKEFLRLRAEIYKESLRRVGATPGPVVDLTNLRWDRIVEEARWVRAQEPDSWIIEPLFASVCDPEDYSWSWAR